MKIVCESCAAKYSISDDKVRGKVFKIRCKKCSHIIVVRGNADGDAGAQEPEAAPPVAAGDGEAVWYVVVEGEQVGPLTEADVAGRIGRAEISGETFAWREGMADWIQVSAIPEFTNTLAAAPAGGAYEENDSPFAPQPTAVYPPGTAESIFGDPSEATPSPMAGNGAPKRSEATEIFGSPTAIAHPPAGQDLFGPQGGGHDPFASPPAAAPSRSSGAGASGGGGFGGGGFFNVPAAAAGAPASAGGGGLTAQRSENSVLFSLSNLEALAAPSPSSGGGFSLSGASPRIGSTPSSSAPPAEGSGLIDIRSMAAMTLGKSDGGFGGSSGHPPSAPELPTFSAAPLSPMAPMLSPARASSGVPGYVYALGGLVVLLLGALTFLVMRSPSAPIVQPLAPQAQDPEPVAAAPVVPPSTLPPTQAPAAAQVKEEALPPREEAPAPAADKPSTTASKKTSGSGGKKSGSAPAATAKAPAEEAPKPAAAPPPAPEKEAPKKGSLDDLLAGAIGGTPKKSAPAATPAPAAEPSKKLGPLGKSDIVKGMMEVMPRTKACYDQYKVPGTANVNIKVGTSGRVEDANVTGKFSGTPTGDCVAKAVKTAKFPPSDGLSFPYPIPLR